MLEQFSRALVSSPGSHELISLISGTRGSGKTVLLTSFEDLARDHSWLVISETASPGFLDRLIQTSRHYTSVIGESSRTIQLSGPSVGPLSLSFASPTSSVENVHIRGALTELFHALEERAPATGAKAPGILITLDELHYVRYDDIVEFAVAVQHLVREGKDIAVVFAGIPSAVRPLLSDDGGRSQITFLRRANRIDLGTVSDADVRRALNQPVLAAGKQWETSALDKAVSITGGYPFLIQIVGSIAFEEATGDLIREVVIDKNLERIQAKLSHQVHKPALHELSDFDREFLDAMAIDDGLSSMADLQARLGRAESQVYYYRNRLIAAGLVVSPMPGKVGFTLPFLRQYLRKLKEGSASASETYRWF